MSRTWIERDWIDRISSQLENFKWVRSGIANFRCNICGDSESNSKKCRAFFYQKPAGYSFKCHNCGEAKKFQSYLYSEFPMEYQAFKLDVLKESANATSFADSKAPPKAAAPEKVMEVIPTYEAITLDRLPESHPAVQYCLGRSLPKNKLDRIVYTDNFKEWLDKNTTNNRYDRMPKDKRILFILKDFDGRVIGVQARSLDSKSSMRYITLKFDDNATKIYGRDYIKPNRPIFVTEGIPDSLFLPNCIALCGGDVGDALAGYDKDQVIIVLDNEPRSRDTVNRMRKAIDLGFRVVVWTTVDSKYKDINDMVSNGGMTPRDVLKAITENIFQGIEATLALTVWKRI